VAPDRPGSGLSDPIERARERYHAAEGAWLDRVLDALELDSAALFGHSAGGVLALRYALAHPERVERLVLVGPPALPNTRCPLPFRLLATPAVGTVLSRLPPSRASVLRFADFMGERETLAANADLVELFIAVGRDRLAVDASRAEVQALVSPFAMLTRSGWRRDSRVTADELRRVTVPTLLVWGEREPLGSLSVAREISELIPNARLHTLATGHAPWLGEPEQMAAVVRDFVSDKR
jgi:pimeloyl-ACP methyl ester carboxylesterase